MDSSEKRRSRSFLCREPLYEVFERLSEEFDCSVDYLINEAMRAYAKAHESQLAAIDAPTSPPQATSDVPPPLPGHEVPVQIARPPLYVHFKGERIPIEKDEFVIGRGARSSDLSIRDGNISRRHAAIVFHAGTYYIKDLGSTNGIEFQGRRVESKRIEDGDVVLLCDYELRFSYQ